MIEFDHTLLQCPITKEELILVGEDKVAIYIDNQSGNKEKFKNIQEGFINKSETYFYPIMEEIILLLPAYALFIGQGEDKRGEMTFDKKRVFEYYNEIDYDIKNGHRIYKDSPKWVDFRDVTSKYIRNSFTKAKKYLSPTGKYLLDIASGPIGLDEYLALSDNFEYRICADISVNALIQAKLNFSPRKGIYSKHSA